MAWANEMSTYLLWWLVAVVRWLTVAHVPETVSLQPVWVPTLHGKVQNVSCVVSLRGVLACRFHGKGQAEVCAWQFLYHLVFALVKWCGFIFGEVAFSPLMRWCASVPHQGVSKVPNNKCKCCERMSQKEDQKRVSHKCVMAHCATRMLVTQSVNGHCFLWFAFCMGWFQAREVGRAVNVYSGRKATELLGKRTLRGGSQEKDLGLFKGFPWSALGVAECLLGF